MEIRFTVPGEPVAKLRARSFKTKSGGIGHFTPVKTKNFEQYVKSLAYEAMAGAPPTDKPARLHISAFFTAPKRLGKLSDDFAYPVVKRPDSDNIAKSVGDALNKVVVLDDSQFYQIYVEKYYSHTPRTVVRIAT